MKEKVHKAIDIMIQFKIGLRTIKTAVAVFLCLLIQFVSPMETALFAAIAAVVCMRETAEKSLSMGVHRFLGTLIGGAFGFLLINLIPLMQYYYDWLYIILVPVAMILCISVCVWTNKKDAVIICCVVFLSIALDPGLNTEDALTYVILRIIDTTIGVSIATLLNHFFFPYEPEENM